MLLNRYFSAVCIGLVCLVQPVGVAKSTPRDNLVAVALTPRQIEAKAARFVVKIDGQVKNEEKDKIEEASGTGFIVNKNGSTYTVLTAAHVANSSIGTRTITTPDGKSYSFTAGNVRILSSKIDLAEITFVSNEIYNVATLSVKTTVSRDSRVQCYGWNAVSEVYRVRGIRSPIGIIEQILPVESSSNGYSLVFNLTTVPGLSGSPLLDENGDVIGVYGLSDGYTSTLGISITTYQRYASIPRPMPVSSINTSVKSTNTNRPIPVIPIRQTPAIDVVRLLVRLSQRRVYVYKGDRIIAQYPVAIGKKGWETPKGVWYVMEKIKNPGWTSFKDGTTIKPGDKRNPLGERWICFWTDGTSAIGFNGTYSPQSVETGTTHGTVRMYDQDIKELFNFVKIGTTVQVVD
jgi:L,D-transpeptidase ErfK/SrfK